MDKSDILGTLKGGLGLAGKLAGKGLGEVSGLLKGRDEGSPSTGLYWQRREARGEGRLLPRLEFLEPQDATRFGSGVMRALTVSRAERSFIQACNEVVLGRLKAADERLRDAVQRDAQLTDGYFLLGCLGLERGEAHEASRSFQKALLCQQGLGSRLRKHLPSLRMALPLTACSTFSFCADLLGLNVLLSLAQRASGRLGEAVATLDQLLGVMPAEPVALFFLSLYHLELGYFRRVVDDLKEVLVDSNVHAADLLLLGKACEGLGDPVTARELYRKALGRQDLDPGLRTDLHQGLGEALVAEGWPGDAEEEFEAVRFQAPGHVHLFRRLGVVPAAAPATVSAREPAASEPPAAAPHREPAAMAPSPSPTPAAASGREPAAVAPSPSATSAAASGREPAAVAPFPSATPAAASGREPAAGAPSPSATSAAASGREPAAGAPSPSATSAAGGHREPAAAPPELVAPVVPRAPVAPESAAPAPAPGPSSAPKPTREVAPPEAPEVAASPPASRPGEARLVCSDRGIDFLLSRQTVLIGREEGDLLLGHDSAASRVHARVSWEEGAYFVEDLNSTNGTWVNGHRLSRPVELHRGDVLQVGQTSLRVV